MILSSYCWTISFTDLRGVGIGLFRAGTGLGVCCFNSNLISSDLLSFSRLALSIFIRLDISAIGCLLLMLMSSSILFFNFFSIFFPLLFSAIPILYISDIPLSQNLFLIFRKLLFKKKKLYITI